MLPNSRRQPLATEGAPNHPRFDGAEAPAELDTIIHIVYFGAGGIAPQVFRDECKNATKPFDFANIENAKVEGHKQHFVWIDYDRVRQIETIGHPFAFRHDRQSASIGGIDVEPHLVFGANRGDLLDRTDARRRSRPDRRAYPQRFEFLPQT